MKGQFFSLRFGPPDAHVLSRLIETAVNSGIDTVCLELEKAFRYESHPEIAAGWAVEKEYFRELAAFLRRKKVKLIPMMPLFSHSEYITGPHPEFREPRSSVYCVNAPGLYEFLIDLIDEVIEVFRPEYFHMGHDEPLTAYDPRKRASVFSCEACMKGKKAHEIFADDIKVFHRHFSERGIRSMIWGDALLDPDDFSESSFCQSGCYGGGVDRFSSALPLLPKDIVICDWHYEPAREFPTLTHFQRNGFKTIACPKHELNSFLFTDYAFRHSAGGGLMGMMGTTWCHINRENFRILRDTVKKNAFFFANPGQAYHHDAVQEKVKKICADYSEFVDAESFHGVYDFSADGCGIYHSSGWRDLSYMEWPKLSDPIKGPHYPVRIGVKPFRHGAIEYCFKALPGKSFKGAFLKLWMKCPGGNKLGIRTEKKRSFTTILENRESHGGGIDISKDIAGSKCFVLRFEAENLSNAMSGFLRRFELKCYLPEQQGSKSK